MSAYRNGYRDPYLGPVLRRDDWTVRLAERDTFDTHAEMDAAIADGYEAWETEPQSVTPGKAVTITIKPPREVVLCRYILSLKGHLHWQDGTLPASERFPVVGGTYTLTVPSAAFHMAIEAWVDYGGVPSWLTEAA